MHILYYTGKIIKYKLRLHINTEIMKLKNKYCLEYKLKLINVYIPNIPTGQINLLYFHHYIIRYTCVIKNYSLLTSTNIMLRK